MERNIIREGPLVCGLITRDELFFFLVFGLMRHFLSAGFLFLIMKRSSKRKGMK
jgi:hypothetical protein